jgi:hypothetical protein
MPLKSTPSSIRASSSVKPGIVKARRPSASARGRAREGRRGDEVLEHTVASNKSARDTGNWYSMPPVTQ